MKYLIISIILCFLSRLPTGPISGHSLTGHRVPRLIWTLVSLTTSVDYGGLNITGSLWTKCFISNDYCLNLTSGTQIII